MHWHLYPFSHKKERKHSRSDNASVLARNVAVELGPPLPKTMPGANHGIGNGVTE